MQEDEHYMQLALHQARLGGNDVAPNPRVGCVLLKDGQIIGQGYTQPPGGNHAEIEALADARQKGQDVRGATAYVTLEPCSHFGRTPPCVDALLRAGVARVVAALADPNPLVAGRGMQTLAAAGVEVKCGLLQAAAEEINAGFLKRMRTGLPWVRMKSAASLDGKTALQNGSSQWITGAEARRDGHTWRARAQVILTGIGTVQADDPQLTARDVPCARQPLRVIVDSGLEISPDARILQGEPVLIAYARPHPQQESLLRAKGAELLHLPNPAGKVDLPALIRELGRREINEVHVEAGQKLNASLIREGCVDELLLYLAPSLLGEGQPMFALPALSRLQDLPLQQQLQFDEIKPIGNDLRLRARFVHQSLSKEK